MLPDVDDRLPDELVLVLVAFILAARSKLVAEAAGKLGAILTGVRETSLVMEGIARDSLLVTDTPIDYLDFSSPVPNLGSKLGLDATRKWPAETSRAWSEPIVPDPAAERQAEVLWSTIQSASSNSSG